MNRVKYFLSIVSHGHYDFLLNNSELLKIAKLPDVFVIVKDNLSESKLKNLCESNGIIYLTSMNRMGFGENNNFVYDHCVESLDISEGDYFLAVNPDVVITVDMVNTLKETIGNSSLDIFAINLFKDNDFKMSEDSLRKFPSFFSLVKLIIRKPVCKSYDKKQLANLSEVDWASGAFLGFKSSLYQRLKGFDPRYFMYYEDVDICFRAKYQCDVGVRFLKEIKAVHVGAYQNRNIFSKHFRWYIASLCKFLIRKSFFGK
jgi:N-acetylglucosaminyl-diphospho-decaprenol L-rhamnosyltransferase